MKRILVDTNVIADVVLDRAPHAAASAAVWEVVETREVEGYLSAHAFTTIFYIVAKAKGPALARLLMLDLLEVFRVAPVNQAILRRAAALALTDFEDAVTSAAAEAARCDAVVTRDPAGFRGGPVEPLAPSTAVAVLRDEVHEPGGDYVTRRRRTSSRTRRPGTP